MSYSIRYYVRTWVGWDLVLRGELWSIHIPRLFCCSGWLRLRGRVW